MRYAREGRSNSTNYTGRMRFVLFIFSALGIALVLKLGYIQLMQYGLYALYASDQHELASQLLPTRGQILVRDRSDNSLHPLATNRLTYQVYAVPKDILDAHVAAKAINEVLAVDEVETFAKLTKRADDPYEPVMKDVSQEKMQALKDKNIRGIAFVQSTTRSYPEKNIGGQLIGFTTRDEKGVITGKYGAEAAFQDLLAGTPGSLVAEKDAGGRRLSFGQTEITKAENGTDVILTIDRTVQYQACDVVKRAVERHSADGGSIVIMDPNTGAVLAMCSFPDFDPTNFGSIKDLSQLNNTIVLNAYEPGSVFKAFTVAAGLDAQKITPKTTYVDAGVEEIDGFKIKNSDGVAHGLQTMTQVLDESLNTGTIFIQRLLGRDSFRSYVEAFGFGKKTGIELSPEAKGKISSLSERGSVFAATGSFGQGLTVSPIQLVSAYASLANGGKLMRPYIVEEIVKPDGTRTKTKPQVLGTPISPRASRLASGMLVSVVENGHGKRAGVPGYWVAGKTGTAQVARIDGHAGYQKDVTIGSFAGYAPASDPRFAMLVKIDHPRDVQWAESSAAPMFGEMARFLLAYYEVPPERPITKSRVVEPVATSSTTP